MNRNNMYNMFHLDEKLKTVTIKFKNDNEKNNR